MANSTTILNPTELKYLLIDSVRSYSEDATYLAGENPYKFSINGKLQYIFIHNVHDSGRGRPNEDECRIQFAQSRNFISAKDSGLPVLFLGYYPKHKVFTAWDPSIQTGRINMREVVSVYSRFSVQQRSSDEGIAVYMDNNGQNVISFKPEYLGLYIENYNTIHKSNEQALLQLIKKSDEARETTDETGETVEIDRERYIITHRGYKRNADFTKTILNIYNEKCAMCDIQLQLVEAAHIVPHAHEQGSNDPRNGVCLCSLHHKAFDSGLIYIDSRYRINVNNAKIEYLAKIDRLSGKQQFINVLYDKIDLPSEAKYNPSTVLIGISNQIRGIPI